MSEIQSGEPEGRPIGPRRDGVSGRKRCAVHRFSAGGVDVARVHGEVGCLLIIIGAIGLRSCIIQAARTGKNATCLPNAM